MNERLRLLRRRGIVEFREFSISSCSNLLLMEKSFEGQFFFLLGQLFVLFAFVNLGSFFMVRSMRLKRGYGICVRG